MKTSDKKQWMWYFYQLQNELGKKWKYTTKASVLWIIELLSKRPKTCHCNSNRQRRLNSTLDISKKHFLGELEKCRHISYETTRTTRQIIPEGAVPFLSKELIG